MKRRCATLLLITLLCAAAPVTGQVDVRPHPANAQKVELIQQADGTYAFVITRNNGNEETFSPDAYAALLHTDRKAQPWYYPPLNITSTVGIAWVALGLLGQVLFTGRMVVQWLVSEKKSRSVVPVSFWWMSLSGASMLILYFVWRQDIVGVLGQSTGWFIYVRNLMLIYGPRKPQTETA